MYSGAAWKYRCNRILVDRKISRGDRTRSFSSFFFLSFSLLSAEASARSTLSPYRLTRAFGKTTRCDRDEISNYHWTIDIAFAFVITLTLLHNGDRYLDRRSLVCDLITQKGDINGIQKNHNCRNVESRRTVPTTMCFLLYYYIQQLIACNCNNYYGGFIIET